MRSVVDSLLTVCSSKKAFVRLLFSLIVTTMKFLQYYTVILQRIRIIVESGRIRIYDLSYAAGVSFVGAHYPQI